MKDRRIRIDIERATRKAVNVQMGASMDKNTWCEHVVRAICVKDAKVKAQAMHDEICSRRTS